VAHLTLSHMVAKTKWLIADLQTALQLVSTPRDIVFVYQMGKVGSSSVYLSLRHDASQFAVVHAHSMSEHSTAFSVRYIKRMMTSKRRRRLFIISLVREPVSRNVSAFFQNFKRYMGCQAHHYLGDLDRLKQVFLDSYPHEIPLTWFDTHIRPQFGFDVYSQPFHKEVPLTMGDDGIHLLVMRSDLDDRKKESFICDFLGISSLRLTPHNVSSVKAYAELYSRFLRHVKFDAKYLERMIHSKYFAHFFEASEARAVLQQWSEDACSEGGS